jgi:hypothetical protein
MCRRLTCQPPEVRLFGQSKSAQADLEPLASAPCRGQYRWPGKAGSTVFLAQRYLWSVD